MLGIPHTTFGTQRVTESGEAGWTAVGITYVGEGYERPWANESQSNFHTDKTHIQRTQISSAYNFVQVALAGCVPLCQLPILLFHEAEQVSPAALQFADDNSQTLRFSVPLDLERMKTTRVSTQ